jgi:hypothetical protein
LYFASDFAAFTLSFSFSFSFCVFPLARFSCSPATSFISGAGDGGSGV